MGKHYPYGRAIMLLLAEAFVCTLCILSPVFGMDEKEGGRSSDEEAYAGSGTSSDAAKTPPTADVPPPIDVAINDDTDEKDTNESQNFRQAGWTPLYSPKPTD